MPLAFRSNCPFTCALDVVGDRWMLVIIKQMLIEGRMTFKDFMDSDDGIATNVLTAKLRQLEEAGIIVKRWQALNKKSHLYLLTDRGVALLPMLLELALWSDGQLRGMHPSIIDGPALEMLRDDKVAFAEAVEGRYRALVAERGGDKVRSVD